jgi:hypothetical protein
MYRVVPGFLFFGLFGLLFLVGCDSTPDIKLEKDSVELAPEKDATVKVTAGKADTASVDEKGKSDGKVDAKTEKEGKEVKVSVGKEGKEGDYTVTVKGTKGSASLKVKVKK